MESLITFFTAHRYLSAEVFTALHKMQTLSSDGNSVFPSASLSVSPSVCPSACQTRAL